jgi:hypothetical protein
MPPPRLVIDMMRSSTLQLGVFLAALVVLSSGYAQAGGAESNRHQSIPEKAPDATFAVVNVAPNDTLNVRARPDAAAPVVGKIPSYGLGVQVRDAGGNARNSAWMPIRHGDLTGWVNHRYLVPQTGCMDETVAARAGQIIWALRHKDMEALSRLVHPDKGVRFSPYAYVGNEDLVFRAQEMRNLMRDQTAHRWGDFDGTGSPINLTFVAYFRRFIYDADFARPQQVGCNTVIGRGNTINNIPAFYPDAVFIEYHLGGADPQQGGLDWRSLRLVLQMHQGAWYLVGVVHDEWTI